jgi:transposase InsO family protein
VGVQALQGLSLCPELFLKEVFPHYGSPLHIVSDRGTQWNSKLFRALRTVASVQPYFSTAYHPQTNGLVERTNETVGAALRSYVGPDMRDWPDSLSFVEFA